MDITPADDRSVDMHPLLFLLGGAAFYGSSITVARLFPRLSAGILLMIGLATITLTILAWIKYVELSPAERSTDEYPRSYSRNRDYRGYSITVEVEERPQADNTPRHIEREVVASATDETDTVISQASSITHAGKLPKHVFDSPMGDESNGTSEGEQTRVVLEQLYDDILEYDSTGVVGDTSGVDSALDVVFGEGYQ